MRQRDGLNFSGNLGRTMDKHSIINIVGEKVALGPLLRDLLPDYQRWINDFSITRNLTILPRPMTMEQEAAWYESQAMSEREVPFTIYELVTWRPIGCTVLHEIDFRDRTAEFGIQIGESDCRGKGYGTETTHLMLDYAFTALGLHSVILRVYEFNLAGLSAYKKAGFREFGRRRESHLMGGKLWDTIYMECLATEFKNSVLNTIFVPDKPRA